MPNRALKALRMFHNYKQAYLAARLDISTPYLSELETGRKPITPQLLDQYAEIFGLPVGSLSFLFEVLDKEELGYVVSLKALHILHWVVEVEGEIS